ncbi:hypothetical protein B0H11DRAFT_2312660 [Mycena galericulata]|nr:hypothetical protein B0H11DRAFT_2312660 [Mycena galericulata]
MTNDDATTADALLAPMLTRFRIPISSQANVAQRNILLESARQVSRAHIGHFYGTACPSMVPVLVPIERNCVTAETVDDLDTTVWVDAGQSTAAATIAPGQELGNRVQPDGTTEVWSITMTSQTGLGPSTRDIFPANTLLPSRVTRFGHPFPWRGDILVTKHISNADGRCQVIDIPADPEETRFIEQLLVECTLREAMTFGHVCCFLRLVVRSMYRRRLLRLLMPFFDYRPSRKDAFFELLGSTRSGINGSVTTASLDWVIQVLNMNAPLVKNVNIVAPHGLQAVWKFFIEKKLKGVLWMKATSFGEYTATADFVSTYGLRHDNNLTITVTTSRTRSILPVLFSAGMTSQHNLLTHTRVMCPNVELTSSDRAVLGWAPTSAHSTVGRMHKPCVKPPLSAWVHTAKSVTDWDEPCGWNCPALKRQVHAFRGIGEFAWGGYSGTIDATNELREEHLKWRLGRECRNTLTASSPTGAPPRPRVAFNEFPVEISTAVFSAYLEADENPAFLVFYLRALLALVCKQWREVLYETASFWTHLHITRCTRPTFIETCVQRTKEATLTIHFDLMSYRHLPVANSMYPTGSKMRKVACMAMADFVMRSLPHIHEALNRVSTLTMECPDNVAWINFMDDLSGWQAGRMADLRVAVLFQTAMPNPAAGLQRFGGVSAIQQMCLTSVTPLWADTTLYASLTILRLSAYRRLSWVTLKAVFLAADNLTTIQLADVNILDPDAADAATLPQVKNFAVSFAEHAGASVLSLVHLPNIDCLRLQAYNDQATISDAFKLHKDIFRSARVIQISAHNGGLGDVERLLQASVSAEDLDFGGCDEAAMGKVLDVVMAGRVHLTMVKLFTSATDFSKQDAERVLHANVFASTCALISGMYEGRGKAWQMRGGAVVESAYSIIKAPRGESRERFVEKSSMRTKEAKRRSKSFRISARHVGKAGSRARTTTEVQALYSSFADTFGDPKVGVKETRERIRPPAQSAAEESLQKEAPEHSATKSSGELVPCKSPKRFGGGGRKAGPTSSTVTVTTGDQTRCCPTAPHSLANRLDMGASTRRMRSYSAVVEPGGHAQIHPAANGRKRRPCLCSSTRQTQETPKTPRQVPLHRWPQDPGAGLVQYNNDNEKRRHQQIHLGIGVKAKVDVWEGELDWSKWPSREGRVLS